MRRAREKTKMRAREKTKKIIGRNVKGRKVKGKKMKRRKMKGRKTKERKMVVEVSQRRRGLRSKNTRASL